MGNIMASFAVMVARAFSNVVFESKLPTLVSVSIKVRKCKIPNYKLNF